MLHHSCLLQYTWAFNMLRLNQSCFFCSIWPTLGLIAAEHSPLPAQHSSLADHWPFWKLLDEQLGNTASMAVRLTAGEQMIQVQPATHPAAQGAYCLGQAALLQVATWLRVWGCPSVSTAIHLQGGRLAGLSLSPHSGALPAAVGSTMDWVMMHTAASTTTPQPYLLLASFSNTCKAGKQPESRLPYCAAGHCFFQ